MFVKKKKYVKIYNVMSYFGGNMKGLKYYIKDSIKNHYAIGAYNFVNMEMLKGICEGAKMTNSPTIVAVSEGAFKYMDENFVKHDEIVEGYLSRVMQHEFDHLEGKVFIDHLSPLRRQMMKGKLNAMLKGKAHCTYKVKTVRK